MSETRPCCSFHDVDRYEVLPGLLARDLLVLIATTQDTLSVEERTHTPLVSHSKAERQAALDAVRQFVRAPR